MSKELERMKEIEARKEELRKEIADGKADEARLSAIKEEADSLAKEQSALRAKMALDDQLEPNALPEEKSRKQRMAEKFRTENRMSMPLFKEDRALLVSSGKLATPTRVETEIGQLPNTVSSIVDDVDCKDATGTGAWKFSYKTADATATDHAEGAAYGGTGATYDFVEIGPSEWGVLDEVSNQVKKQTPIAYALF